MDLNTLRYNLQLPYQQENWKEWLGEILGRQINFENKPEQIFIEKGKAKQIERFASITLSDYKNIAVLDILTSKDVQIARNRVALREIVFKLIDQDKYHGLLVFYHSEDAKQLDYRLSFISNQTLIDSDGNFVNQSTNPKRYSFILGENESCYTPAQRLTNLKAKQPQFIAFENNVGISLKDLTDTFSVEALNNEFFKKYKDIHYKRIWEYIANKEEYAKCLLNYEESELVKQQKPIRDFAKKLLGRIVFLHFVQKKGWMGCPVENKDWVDGDKQFVKHLFKDYPYKEHFYSQALTTLFFNVLNTKRHNDKGNDLIPESLHYVSPIKKSLIGYKAPFLNGGLFDDDQKETNIFDFPVEYFEDLFEFFSQYNFTIDENSPDEQEVGIDPEMLGHIFENLLEENKDKGAFYTPKEIVRYMCQESLIAYLHTHTPETLHPSVEKLIRTHKIDDCLQDKPNATLIQKLLVAVKICDPAIGSGAFPMGMLNEIFMVRRLLFGFLGKNVSFSACLVKKEIIQNNIYGVDIEQGAVDIARLRFWLALVVDEDVPQALPNLDYKIIQGNSLVESFEGHDLSKIIKTKNSSTGTSKSKIAKNLFGEIENPQLTMGFDAAHTEANLNLLIREYFQINNSEDKHKKADIINDQIKEHIKNCAGHTPEVIEKVNAIDFNNKSFFLWHLYFADVFENGGFDVVIGNPPYIKEATNRSAFQGFRDTIHYQGKMDLWYGFASVMMDNLKPNTGILSFIATNNWVTNAGASKFRNKIVSETQIMQIIDFANFKIFESADIQTMIMFFKANKRFENYKFDFRRIIDKDVTFGDILKLLNQSKDEKFKCLNPDFDRNYFINKTFVFSDENESKILNTIFKKGNFFIDGDNELMSGIDVLQDAVNKRSLGVLGDDFKVGDGIFVLSNSEKEAMEFTDAELSLIKPYYTTKELQRIYGNKNNLNWIIYTNSSFKNPEKIKSFPKIKAHLEKFQEVITSENGIYGLNRPRDEYYFKGEKILSVRKCATPAFTYTDFDCYVSRAFFSIKSTRINHKYLTGILNSKVIAFWLKKKGKMQGFQHQIDKDPLLNIPIYKTTDNKQQPIVELVDKIIKSKEIDIEANTLDLEQQIDLLVYKLYELSYDEVLLIEPDFGQRVSVEEYEKIVVE